MPATEGERESKCMHHVTHPFQFLRDRSVVEGCISLIVLNRLGMYISSATSSQIRCCVASGAGLPGSTMLGQDQPLLTVSTTGWGPSHFS